MTTTDADILAARYGFYSQIDATPLDRSIWLVFADWLDEHGDHDKDDAAAGWLRYAADREPVHTTMVVVGQSSEITLAWLGTESANVKSLFPECTQLIPISLMSKLIGGNCTINPMFSDEKTMCGYLSILAAVRDLVQACLSFCSDPPKRKTAEERADELEAIFQCKQDVTTFDLSCLLFYGFRAYAQCVEGYLPANEANRAPAEAWEWFREHAKEFGAK